MKQWKGRIWILTIAVLMLALLGWTWAQNAQAFSFVDTTEQSTVMLEGEYTLDGSAPQKIDNEKPIGEHFKSAVFRGRFINHISAYGMMNILSKNVWYRLYDELGNELFSYQPYLSNTPGYRVAQVDIQYLLLNAKGEVTLEVEYPYELKTENFSDCFKVILSESEGNYLRFFFDALPPIVIFLLICFFGVFFFPIASGLLGRIDYRYIAFGALCFFMGLFMVANRFSGYMNLWIMDPAVCMMTEKVAGSLFVIAVLIYLRSLMEKTASIIISYSLITAFFALTVLCVILHMNGTADMMATAGARYIAVIICAVIMTVLLCIEIRGKKGFRLVDYLLSWAPLGISLVIDIFDFYLHIAGARYLQIGLAITILYQMVRFGADFRRQYKEAIHYQQVQRELYESKVSVMVSQVRPHFMYNALSSIAILCKLDPDTAYTATVTFSDYLRGNMDSLRQNAPVPFEQELEHLKKYLYIEKLRFDDKLNIEYDIQDTDFEIPLLSVQPLVENAVKHGVGMKDDGGTVKISTRETDTAHEVIIEDDGVGFDVSERKDDGRSHIGMENTKKRLLELCGGEVVIESEIGKGTVAKMIIPKKEENKA